MIEDEILATGELLPMTEEQDLHELRSRLDLIGIEISKPFDELYDVMDQQGEAFASQFGAKLDEKADTLDHKPTGYEEHELIMDAVESMDNAPFRDWLAATGPALRERIKEAKMLEPIVEELANREFHETRDRLLASANWDEIIAKHTADDDYPDLRGLFAALNGEIGANKLDFRFAMDQSQNLQDWQERFAAQGDVLPSSVSLDPPEGWKPRVELRDDLRDWESSVRQTYGYLSASRETSVKSLLQGPINSLTNLCFGIELYPDSKTPPDLIPPAIAQALERHVDILKQRFYKQDEEYLESSLTERPNALFIGNQQLLRATTGLDDVPAWLYQRLSRHPESLISGLGFVNFVDGINKRVMPDGSILSTMGEMNPQENTITVDIAESKLTDSTGQPYQGINLNFVRSLNRSEIDETLDHEAAHYAHLQRLPIAWLEKWNAVIASEPVNVTHYVENMRSPNPVNHGNPDSEDLADSTSLYFNRPWTLYMMAPQRFAILNERDERYPQDLLDTALDHVTKHGQSPASAETANSLLSASADQLIAEQLSRHSQLTTKSKRVE